MLSNTKILIKRFTHCRFISTSVDAVVIGGGVVGTSTLYNLAKQGITNTVLIEQQTLTAAKQEQQCAYACVRARIGTSSCGPGRLHPPRPQWALIMGRLPAGRFVAVLL